MRGRRVQRTNAARMQMTLLNPDALCGIVFVKEPLMAKILFMLIVDMSRCHPKLSYLCAQYCAVEHGTDPLELKECQRQGKKQEDVLKKFRMHECNLLLATPALEEGIDLPRCNLVLRWDVPPSYRSYLLCRGRARAPRSAAAVLSGAGHGQTDQLLRNVAIYRELDQIITRKCGCGIQNEPPQVEEDHADTLNNIIKPYVPVLLKNPNKTTNFIENKAQAVKTESIENESKKNSDKSDSKNSDENDSKSSDTSDPTDTSEALVRTENNLKNENLVCNKCTGVKPCASAECLCVNGSDVKTDVRYEVKSDAEVVASVDLNTAIALINRYCGKLPSDTFTRLAPQWWMETVQLPDESGTHRTAYICTLRLPLNCPVKYNIVGHPMPTVVLAKRMVALQACRILHKSGELDDNLMPIGKENFKAAELETNSNTDDETNDSARPGTTKRRQYYYKRTAWAFTDCQPVIDTSDSEIDSPENGAPEATPTENKEIKGGKRNMLYAIVCRLCCALPERYNTRGRRLHAPQHAAQALGILMARDRPTRWDVLWMNEHLFTTF
ncbi:endoribonuclease Dicer-like [Manduca sexta]|uniref:endoribonuclease Dicer-like n=1 Tax=Manduca sexta TaxID=7130 RepID=UPI00188FCAB9|nr:endoribonuclease Dicer-like [Manduca sexta]